MGECDRSGLWYSLDRMQRQYQWAGNNLSDTGLLVGPDQLDIPQPQLRAPILPPDPIPRLNPRPSPSVTQIPIVGQPLPTSPGNQGFTQYVLGASGVPGQYPTDKTRVLALIASLSGVSTPGGLIDDSLTITQANVSVVLMAANPIRSYLLLYNPSAPQTQVVFGSPASWGREANLILGPGEAYLWATAQGLGPVPTLAMSLVGLTPAVPFFAWQV